MEIDKNCTKELEYIQWLQLKRVKGEGLENDLIERIVNDSTFNLSREEIEVIINPTDSVGRASSQVVEFINEYINPYLEKYKEYIDIKSDINV